MTENKEQKQQNPLEPTKYVFYRNPQEFNRHFYLCRRLKIPFLAVSRKGDVSTVEFDLITAETLLSAVGYNELLALRDDLFERKLTRDVITSRVNGLFKVKRQCEVEVLDRIWQIIGSPNVKKV
jgi:hypothetical protein